MRKVKQTSEKTPPLPKDKPATYDNTTKLTSKVGDRQNQHQPEDKDAPRDPQKTRERLEHDPSKKERDPGMTHH
ncbi:MAG: hypothetical protein JST90_19300 [Bacteroidetes bacterium]|nr:hypothetical protein [Bacteroidota bacterium]